MDNKNIQLIVDTITKYGLRFFGALLVFLIGFKLVDYFVNKTKNGAAFSKLEKTSQTFISSIIGVVLKIVITIIAVSILGIPGSTIIAILGSCGLALGLALQGGLSNIAGGVMIMLFKPFKVGDFIDNHTDRGTVKEINIFHTVIETYEGNVIVLPNGNLSNSVIVNYSRLGTRKVEVKLAVNYNSDIDKVRELILKEADKSNYKVTNSKLKNQVFMVEHADSAIVFSLRMWVKQENYWDAKYELLENIKRSFDKNGIEIPYQQIDVHLDKLK